MKILFLSYYFEPDLSAGSFRNSSLLKTLSQSIPNECSIDVITTQPNRYDSFKIKAQSKEKLTNNITIHRIDMPSYDNGMLSQVKLFTRFYFQTLIISKKEKYDLVYASSSKLFTALLGSRIARRQKAKLYLDIRDLFKETIIDVFDNKVLKLGFKVFLGSIEKYTFKRADHINLVSEGFRSYFNKYSHCTYTYFTNGIDRIFINKNEVKEENKSQHKTIVYGGNIGEGQGLEIIIPQLAYSFPEYKFVIIGDGGAKEKLVTKVKEHDLDNVVLLNPMNRLDLISHYNKADYLFMHLNNFKAFERVLPSKLFEYGSFDKPIIAGVSGYATHFLSEEMSNVILFKPGDYKDLIQKLNKYKYKTTERKEFIKKYSRDNINKKMTQSILLLLSENK